MKYLSIHLSIYLFSATGLSKALINQTKKGDRLKDVLKEGSKAVDVEVAAHW